MRPIKYLFCTNHVRALKKNKKTVGSTAKQNKIHQDLKATKHFQQQFTFKSFLCFVLKTIIRS